MRILNRIAIAAVLALFLTAALTPVVEAACSAPVSIGTTSVDGKSFIWSAATFVPTYNGYPNYAPYSTGAGNTTVSPAFEGVFWSAGFGDPTIGLGDDNGAFAPSDGWFYYRGYGAPYYFYYAAEIFTTWAALPSIDGCLLNGGGGTETCTCVLLTDQDGADGFYAMVSNRTNIGSDTFLNQPGNDGNGNAGPIILQPVPKTFIEGNSWSPATGDIELTVNVSGDPGNYNLDPTCNCGPIGYRVVQQQLTRGSAPPDTRDAAAWTPVDLVGGAPQPVNGNPLGASVTVQSLCGLAEDKDVYLATQLVFDSGFDATVVSGNSTRIECGPTIAEPNQPSRPRIRPGSPVELRQQRRSR
mgnify:FL=1